MAEMRTAEVRDRGVWTRIAFEDFKIGDDFRLFEGETLVAEGTVASNPKPCEPPGNFSFLTVNNPWLIL